MNTFEFNILKNKLGTIDILIKHSNGDSKFDVYQMLNFF